MFFPIKIKRTLSQLSGGEGGGGWREEIKFLSEYYLALFVVPVVTRCHFLMTKKWSSLG